MIEGYDASLGAVLGHLKRREVASNTIVLFTSDNGGLSVHSRGRPPEGVPEGSHNAPLRAGKGSAYEGGTRVPWLVSWAEPDDTPLQRRIPVEAGALRSTPILIEDVYPSVLGWAGLSEQERVVDGVDLTPLLAREGAGERSSRPLVFHYPHVWGPRRDHMGYEPHSAIRLDGWKAIWFYERAEWELYDLVNDPGETTDLAATNGERLTLLGRELLELLDLRGAQFPRLPGRDEPVKPQLP